MRVEAVIFDWGGTLSHWALVEFDQVWRMAAAHLAPHLGQPGEHLAARLAQVELDAWQQMGNDHRAFTFRDLVNRASAAIGADVADAIIEEASEHYLSSWVPHIEHDPDDVPLLEALRERGIRTGLLSNTHWPAGFHEAMLERDGLAHLLDACVYTSELRYTKPHPEAFEAALQAVGITDPSRAVYVGDRLFDDVFGAQRAGMRAIHRPNAHVPDFDVRPDARIERLGDLLDVVLRWDDEGGR
ncbi:MAG: HAD family hydrolase [Chloroflexi bacterium]|nr:HAD family hydrolase [Chloroflexota bacterium]